MNQNTIIAAVGGLLVGTLAGYTIGMKKGMDAASDMVKAAGGMPAAAAPAPAMPPGGAPAPAPGAPAGQSPQQVAELTQRIDMNLRIVAKDPKNVAAWIALGNDYFDTRQLQKSIDAYGEALKLQPGNPDVLTDQGVMYEQQGNFDQALANFEQANKIAPTHVQSLYNIGVVYSHKKDAAKAAAAWRKVIETAPTSPQAAEARAGLAQLGVK
ncbi:MAG TPA: tetratricopeptide repeat protein [Anaeromyxobacteraceae bacterium]|nr:tetratricopeptide repeat protein [Anaeromyxobacteraceae bacterium]